MCEHLRPLNDRIACGRTGSDADTSSFAVPFEEDERDPKTFFLDLDYVEEMWRMFRKVNGGWGILSSAPLGGVGFDPLLRPRVSGGREHGLFEVLLVRKR